MYKILKKEALSSNVYLFEVEAPQIAQKAQAGQFVILRIHEHSERIPLTIADFSRDNGTVTIIFQSVGATTQELAEYEIGDAILDLAGPLGVPSEIENYGTVVCVGGGIGIAPIYPIVCALKEAGNKVVSIIGARSADILFWQDKLAKVSDQVLVATDDGSAGHKGFVTDVLVSLLKKEKISRVWAIGPMIMMKNVARTTKPYDVKTLVSLNPIMVDGTGMCGACRVSVGTETKFACVDGPEFDGHLVDFDLAMKRSAFFKEEEQKATHHCKCGGDCKCH